MNFGGNFGANFARSSNVMATVGKNEGITQSFTNYTIKHTLEILEQQMKRYEQSTALGMWDFAAYVLSEDTNVANNVAHSYLALTQGEQSYMSQTAVNLWRGDMGKESDDAKEICSYLRELRHPLFGLSPALTALDSEYNAYPAVITAATSLSGKELAYSLNFPQKSVAGLPVIECAEFGRNVISYEPLKNADCMLNIGNVFHMNRTESALVRLTKKSLCSHTFITGSTGSGKSNTVYQILNEALEQDIKFLVIEPAKGEYKQIFGNDPDVNVYGTNPYLSQLLRLNPFSFPQGIHIFEHLDRLVEIFNVCWPMYAAMPAVMKNAIEKSYLDCGWDLIRSVNKYGEAIYPTFADVAQNIKLIIESSEYDAENKGAYKGSLLTRLESLTNGINGTIFTVDEIEPKKLFEENVIVDLSRVGSTETKSLIMGMLVLKLQEYRMTKTEKINSDLKHITVLEEAHNFQDIKPESHMSVKDANEYWDNVLNNDVSKTDNQELGEQEPKNSEEPKQYLDDNGVVYRNGDELVPNTRFEKNGYFYETDEKGRIVRAEGKLQLKDHDGYNKIKESRETVAHGKMAESDDRAHLIGDRFNGSGELENLVPMDAKLNQGDYKKLENTLADAVKDGKDVRLKVEPVYENNSFRPTEFRVSYSINGEKDVVIFKNGSGDLR